VNDKPRSRSKSNPGWFPKGRSGNPGGRPATSPASQGSAFDVLLEKTLTVTLHGATREITVWLRNSIRTARPHGSPSSRGSWRPHWPVSTGHSVLRNNELSLMPLALPIKSGGPNGGANTPDPKPGGHMIEHLADARLPFSGR
jgi:hypothetical protein